MVGNIYVKFHYDWLRIDRALGNLQKMITTRATTIIARTTFVAPLKERSQVK